MQKTAGMNSNEYKDYINRARGKGFKETIVRGGSGFKGTLGGRAEDIDVGPAYKYYQQAKSGKVPGKTTLGNHVVPKGLKTGLGVAVAGATTGAGLYGLKRYNDSRKTVGEEKVASKTLDKMVMEKQAEGKARKAIESAASRGSKAEERRRRMNEAATKYHYEKTASTILDEMVMEKQALAMPQGLKGVAKGVSNAGKSIGATFANKGIKGVGSQVGDAVKGGMNTAKSVMKSPGFKSTAKAMGAGATVGGLAGTIGSSAKQQYQDNSIDTTQVKNTASKSALGGAALGGLAVGGNLMRKGKFMG